MKAIGSMFQKLQQEYIDEYGDDIVTPRVASARNRITLRLKPDQKDTHPYFKELWDRLSQRTQYIVNIDSTVLFTDSYTKKNT